MKALHAFFAVSLGALLGCGGGGGDAGSPTTPSSGSPGSPSPGASPLAGQWTGTTSQGLPIYLRVGASGAIDTLSVRLTAAFDGPTCTGTVIRTGVAIAADSTFQASVGIGFSTTLRGKFGPGATLTGTVDAYTGAYGASCGSLTAIGSGTVVSAMQWQGSR